MPPGSTGSRATQSNRHQSSRPVTTRPGSTVSKGPVTGTETTYEDDAGVGAMARAILRGSPARRLVIEITYVTGRKPAQDSIGHLVTILRRETVKNDGIIETYDDPIPASKSSYSLNDLVGLEARYRRLHSTGSVATIWIAALNGSFAGDSNTLGLEFRATAAAIFEDQIQNAATLLVSAGSIERSVITHETGHLLGLINIGYRSAYDHEDPQHPHHSKYQTSVMYWAIDDMSIAAILTGGPPDDFDQYDRADLAALRSS